MTEEQTVNIKQRIIGAIVLVSLGIIFIPLLLNGGLDSKQSISGTNIPPMPKTLKWELVEPPKAKKTPQAKVIVSKPIFSSSSSSKPKPKPNLVSKPVRNVAYKPHKPVKEKTITEHQYKQVRKPATARIDSAYTLQIASFSKKSNAVALRDKLKNKGFKAYIERTSTAKGKVYRLRAGPYLQFDQISRQKKKIEKQFKVSNTVIVKYKT